MALGGQPGGETRVMYSTNVNGEEEHERNADRSSKFVSDLQRNPLGIYSVFMSEFSKMPDQSLLAFVLVPFGSGREGSQVSEKQFNGIFECFQAKSLGTEIWHWQRS
jgi:hypothetical protein